MKFIDSSRASLAMSATALFVALGGTAMAVTKIGTAQLRNGAVTGAKLHNGAVSTSKLAGGAVSSAKLAGAAVQTRNVAAGAITGAQLAAGAVGTGNLAAGAVGSGNLADGSVTNAKLADGAVTTSKLADNAVTSAKVADGSLTASDVAANTFLAAGATAANSRELGGLTASGFIQGTGRWVSNRVVVAAGQSAPILELNFAHIQGVCDASSHPIQQFVAELNLDNVIYSAINSGGTTDLQTANALTAGSFLEATHTTSTPQTVTWQGAVNNNGTEQLATAWVSGQDEGGSCVFIAQGTTTLG